MCILAPDSINFDGHGLCENVSALDVLSQGDFNFQESAANQGSKYTENSCFDTNRPTNCSV